MRIGRRAATLLAFPGLMLVGFAVEVLVLAPRAAQRPRADDVAYWERHVARNQSFPGSRVRLALAYQADGRLPDARRAFEEAIALDPESEAATIGRYGILHKLGEHDLAIADLARFAAEHPRCAVCWQNLAAAYLDRGRLDDARDAAEALLASGLTVTSGMYDAADLHYEAFVMAGRVYAARGEQERAIALLRDAVARDPRDPRAHLLLARSLLASDRREAAAASLDEAAARVDPGAGPMRRQIESLRQELRRAEARS